MSQVTDAKPSQEKKYKIMVVDDEPAITASVQLGLEEEGFAVDAYNDPLEALGNFKPGYYDEIILDIKMPNMTGIDLAGKIWQIDKDAIICFITGFNQYEDEALKLILNTKGRVITNPFLIKDIVSHIKTHLSDQPRLSLASST